MMCERSKDEGEREEGKLQARSAQSTPAHEQWEQRSAAEALTEAEHTATYEATATCSLADQC